ncbi:calmodulin calcium-dependent NAD kinase-like [Arachis stenosperma]|uniref:calmodulin calcium-dependent NAD kinase-like n=1 Tax=Arachis stenosperma TaxID=217475 RepID=UPI0025AB8441|nr:calmodulin calcium-dependent NAD kinase-like [Arachis stenosperma]
MMLFKNFVRLKRNIGNSSLKHEQSPLVLLEKDVEYKKDGVIAGKKKNGGTGTGTIKYSNLPLMVHQSSTDAASSLLVRALNEGRDVIMDGTLSWEPFVEQRLSPWQEMFTNAEEEQPEENNNGEPRDQKPYRIELVGVVCDGYLAIVRGISYYEWESSEGEFTVEISQKLIEWKDDDHNLLVDPEDIKCLEMIGGLNVEADSIYELYKEPSLTMEPGSVSKEIILSSSRTSHHKWLRETILKIGKSNKKQ